MAVPLHLQVLLYPASSAVTTLCVGVYLWLQHRGLSPAAVGLSYQHLVHERQWWRAVTAQVSHFDLLHLVMNVSSLWGLAAAAEPSGRAGASLAYLRTSGLLLLASAAITVGVTYFLVRVLRWEAARHVVQVGYSCVLFGWMGLLAFRPQDPPARFDLLGFAPVPLWLAPLLLLLVTQVVLPRASFVGHLSGLLAGGLMATGCLDWLTPYWTGCLVFWVAVGMCYGLVREGRLGRPYFRLVTPEPSDGPDEVEAYDPDVFDRMERAATHGSSGSDTFDRMEQAATHGSSGSDAFDRMERAATHGSSGPSPAPAAQPPGAVTAAAARVAAAAAAAAVAIGRSLGSRLRGGLGGSAAAARRGPASIGQPSLPSPAAAGQPQWPQGRSQAQVQGGRAGALGGGLAAGGPRGAAAGAGAVPGLGAAAVGPTTAAAGPALPWGAPSGGPGGSS